MTAHDRTASNIQRIRWLHMSIQHRTYSAYDDCTWSYSIKHFSARNDKCVYRFRVLIRRLLSSGMPPCSVVPIYYCFGEISWLHTQGRTLSMEAATSFCRFKAGFHLTRRLIPQDSSKLLLNVTQEFTVNIHVRDSDLNWDPGMGAIHMWKGKAVEIMSSKNRFRFLLTP
jgi:hypothetical protein